MQGLRPCLCHGRNGAPSDDKCIAIGWGGNFGSSTSDESRAKTSTATGHFVWRRDATACLRAACAVSSLHPGTTPLTPRPTSTNFDLRSKPVSSLFYHAFSVRGVCEKKGPHEVSYAPRSRLVLRRKIALHQQLNMTVKRGVLGIETGPPREQKRTAEAVGPQRQDGARGSGSRAGLLGSWGFNPGVSSRGFHTPYVLA